MAASLGITTYGGDGNDVTAVYEKVGSCLSEIRAGSGPQLLEFSTYRWLEHCGPAYDNDIGYRSEAEFLEWKAKEPITRFEKKLLDNEIVTVKEIDKMNESIALEVKDAFEFAESSPFPDVDKAFEDLYSENPDISPIPISEGK